MTENILSILEEKKIKTTSMRMLVLEQLMKIQEAKNLTEIEHLLSPTDRITIYRTLKTFVKKGLVHKIEDASSIKYALCHNECTS